MKDLQRLLKYLSDLENNNNREWFQKSKDERKIILEEFEALIQSLLLGISGFDETIPLLEPASLTFKMVRDTRFSHDKSPYNPALRAHMGPKGKLPVPVGYYLYIRPNNQSFLGGGLFTDVFGSATAMVRDYLAEHGKEFEAVIHDKEFIQHFTVQGTQLKNVPRGYEKEHPMAEFLKYKNWYLEYPLPDAMFADSTSFVEKALYVFQQMKSFNHFLNNALADFKMPNR